MSAVPKRLLTPAEYLAQERRADFRSEYYRGEVFAMAGARFPHNRAKENLAREIGVQLKGGPCDVFSSDQRVKIEATGLYTYPDIVIYCGEPQFEDDQLDTLLNPIAVIEVLSESTEAYDRGEKAAQYRSIPSLQEYILVAQSRVLVERYARQADATWSLTELSDLSQTLEFASVPVRVPLAEVYDGVPLSERPLR